MAEKNHPGSQAAVSETADRELSITRLLNAPVELVFKVWTDPGHITQWWGPTGFTSTIHTMDVRQNGVWDFIMHGPDGTDYKNTNVFADVVKNERIVYDHVNSPKHRATITFTGQGDKTLLSMTMVFESAQELELVDKKYGAGEGQKQTIGRLEEYLGSFDC